MNIGIPREIKPSEGRVALTPAGVWRLIDHGHRVFIEKGAGKGSGIPDENYELAGALVADSPETVWDSSDLIIKVKEPIDPEFDYMHEGQILFTYLHLAANETLTRKLMDKKIIGIAYETVQLEDGSLPLLAPMSAVAGRLSIQVGCACLEVKNGGKGILVSGVPGVHAAKVTILGAGISGINAAHLAIGMGARVTILDIDQKRLNYLADIFHSRAVILMSHPAQVEDSVAEADLVIGSVLIPGARTPRLIDRNLLKEMEPGSAIVDIAIDQGGCAETSRPTTHDAPIFEEEGIVHYCVANMPGLVPRTSTHALNNLTLPYVLNLADLGLERALEENRSLRRGLNVNKGKLANVEVARAFDFAYEEYVAV